MIAIALKAVVVVLAFAAGLLVGRKNPSIASAAAKVAADAAAKASAVAKAAQGK